MSKNLMQQIRQILFECEVFYSNDSLQALFVDPRIKPWKKWLRQPNTTGDRVNMLLDLLQNVFHEQYQQNGLALFLEVLGNHYHPDDARHGRLQELSDAWVASVTIIPVSIETKVSRSTIDIESPYGTMNPQSPFYIERSADDEAWQHLTHPEAVIVTVQGARQMGKSSLVLRILNRLQSHKKTVFIDFQKLFSQTEWGDKREFLIQLCLAVGETLKLEEAIDRYWNSKYRTPNYMCEQYFVKHIFPQVEQPLVLAFDEVDRMETTDFGSDFFGMIRGWYNDRHLNPVFNKISFLLSISTDPRYLIDNHNQSPFNVAHPVYLTNFTDNQVNELNQRHGNLLSSNELTILNKLLNGHPFLTRLALYQLAKGLTDMQSLQAKATSEQGIFGGHLADFVKRLATETMLKEALFEIATRHRCGDERAFDILKGMGLVQPPRQRVTFRNQLYELFFKEWLGVY